MLGGKNFIQTPKILSFEPGQSTEATWDNQTPWDTGIMECWPALARRTRNSLILLYYMVSDC